MTVIFLTQLKKPYKNIKIIYVSQSLKNDINTHTETLIRLHKKVDTSAKLVKRFHNLIVDYLQKIFNTCLKTVPSLMTLTNL